MGHEERDELIERRYAEGLGLRAVAAEVGLTPEGVRRVLQRRGAVIRSPSSSAPASAEAREYNRKRREATAQRQAAAEVARVLADPDLRQVVLAKRTQAKDVPVIARELGLRAETVRAVLADATAAEIRSFTRRQAVPS